MASQNSNNVDFTGFHFWRLSKRARSKEVKPEVVSATCSLYLEEVSNTKVRNRFVNLIQYAERSKPNGNNNGGGATSKKRDSRRSS